MQNQYNVSAQPGQSGVMPEPPAVLTTKDHLYLKDSLSWELVATKRFHQMAQQTGDPDLRMAFERAGQMHQRHYQVLLSHLQPGTYMNNS